MTSQPASAGVSPVGNPCDLAHLSDGELIEGARRLVGTSNYLFAQLLAHLGEVEARGIHRNRACSSLYTYCIYELRFSEDAAFRRVSAARLVRKFPVLFDAVASGELHLTGLLMLGPHLTPENCAQVLERAKHRTKKELGRLVRELDPLPDVAPRIEPLGPAPAREVVALRNPSQAEYALSLNPVRELLPGERPRDWIDETLLVAANDLEIERAAGETKSLEPPQRYRVQFTATEEYVDLVERAKALLSTSGAGSSLVEVHLRAMRDLVARLEKQKHAVNKTRRASCAPVEMVSASGGNARTLGPAMPTDRDAASVAEAEFPAKAHSPSRATRQRGRCVPAAIRREVFLRDDARCTYTDECGQRCRETHQLELHHLRPFAQGGRHVSENLTLRCRAHNALAAEEDFGRGFIEERRDGHLHESFRRQGSS